VVIRSKQAPKWTTQSGFPMSFPKPDERVETAHSAAKPVTGERAYLPLLHDIIYRHISHLRGGSTPKGGLPRPRSTAEQSRAGQTGAQPIATCCSRDGIRMSLALRRRGKCLCLCRCRKRSSPTKWTTNKLHGKRPPSGLEAQALLWSSIA
jgi:hypothetical protein